MLVLRPEDRRCRDSVSQISENVLNQFKINTEHNTALINSGDDVSLIQLISKSSINLEFKLLRIVTNSSNLYSGSNLTEVRCGM